MAFVVMFINNHLLFPDYQKLWLPFAKRKIKKIIRRENVDIVFISAPPFSILTLSGWIKEKWNIPVVIDFRDPFTFNHQTPPEKIFKKKYALESVILTSADHIIANTEKNRKTLLEKFGISGEKVSAIPNGFDPLDYTLVTGKTNNKVITITHTGVFYDNYNAAEFLKILAPIKSILENHVKIRFVGLLTPSDFNIIRQLNLENIIEYIPYCPHSEALKYMYSSDFLLLILPTTDWDFWVPSKTYEYLVIKKPVITIVPQHGDCAKIIEETGTGIVIDPADSNAIAKILLEIASGNGISFNPDITAINK